MQAYRASIHVFVFFVLSATFKKIYFPLYLLTEAAVVATVKNLIIV